MTMNTTSANQAFLPEAVGQLVVKPVSEQSLAGQVGTVVNISSHDYRVPLVTADPSAAWIAEGAEITASDATFDELVVTPSKLGGLSVITRELADDSSPSAQAQVGAGLTRDLVRKLNAAFCGSTTTNGPAGLGSLTTSVVEYDLGGIVNLDPFLEARSISEGVGGNITSWVTDPATALAIATAKEGTNSERNLLSGRTVDGSPLIVSEHVTAGTIWGIDSRYVQLVLRDNARLETDRSVYFSSDQVAVKATLRAAFAFTHPMALVKLTEAAA